MIQLEIGEIFADQYQLKAKLGEGSFSEVWLAENKLAGFDVAVKIYSRMDENGINEFREEFKIAYKLHHPNLLHLNHFDVYKGCPFLVMPYCANGSCANLIGKMNERQVWHFIRDVSKGLMFLHSLHPQIIHQDIKPGNILIDDDNKFIISDFGISQKMEHTLRKSTGVSFSSGTMAYMGPERFSEKANVVATSDIWSLGMSVIELITGEVLWGGMGGCAQLNGAFVPSFNEICSIELQELIKKCLASDTWLRPSAQQVYEYACYILEGKSAMTSSIAHSMPLASASSLPSSRFIEHPKTKTNEPTAKKYVKLALWIAASLIALLLVIRGISTFLANVEEESNYTKCRTIHDFRQFLIQYPHSSYATDAKQKISTLVKDSLFREQMLSKRKMNPDSLTENHTKKTKVTYTYPTQSQISRSIEKENDTLLVTYPNPISDSSITDLEEKNMFLSCQTVTDYQRYLNKYPNGTYVREAKKAIRLLDQNKATTSPKVIVNKREPKPFDFGHPPYPPI